MMMMMVMMMGTVKMILGGLVSYVGLYVSMVVACCKPGGSNCIQPLFFHLLIGCSYHRNSLISEIVNSREIFNLWCSRNKLYGHWTLGVNKAVASAAGEFVFKAFVAF